MVAMTDMRFRHLAQNGLPNFMVGALGDFPLGIVGLFKFLGNLKRAKGFKPSTPTLVSLRSTVEFQIGSHFSLPFGRELAELVVGKKRNSDMPVPLTPVEGVPFRVSREMSCGDLPSFVVA